ncbi:MAG: hypothetical protein ACD_75C01227G0004 [uncultured bacterium]|nr:MAG: hypothetical protein ACD_75C01227G0004 [uncultured bacterium]
MNAAELRSPAADNSADLSAVVVSLLRGVLYQEEKVEVWNGLINLQAAVRDYVAVLGLELILDEAEGYAFLRSRPEEEEKTEAAIPRLVRRQPLSFPVSLLLALLRKKLAEFDATGGETRLILSAGDIAELIRVFLPAGSNEAKLIDQVDSHLSKVVKLGFIRPLHGQKQMFEVRRILKAFVDAQWLSEFDQRLALYQQELATKGGASHG